MRCASVQRPDQVRARSTSSFFSKTVSDAIKGFYRIEFGVDATELAANSLDVTVDRAIVDIDVVLVCDVEQLVSRFHYARALGQSFEDQEFGDGEGDVLAVPQYLVACRVHDQ